MFTPPAQLNVFDFLFNRGEMFTPLNLKDIQLGPLTIPLGRSDRSPWLRIFPPYFLPNNSVLLFMIF